MLTEKITDQDEEIFEKKLMKEDVKSYLKY